MEGFQNLIDLLPELEEAPWGKEIPAFAEWKISCRNIYPDLDNYSGFVYGKNLAAGIIYFSPFSLGEDNHSPNTSFSSFPFPGIDIARIVDIEVRRFHR